MPKNSKGEKIEILYNKRDRNKITNKKKTKTLANKKRKDNIINLDNEIIIGLTPKQDGKNAKKKNNHPRKTIKNKEKKKKNNTKKLNKKSIIKKKIIKWTTLSLILIIALILFILSDVFNIKQISVENNSKVSSEEIIRLSGLTVDENMFKILNNKIKEGIKNNAYIEEAKITKNLDGTVKIYVEERVTSYMLQYENYYAYMNSQGYILEISDIKLELPMITGYKTQIENIQPGNRLNDEDLEMLGIIIEIMQAAQSKEIEKKITYIDITDKNNIIIKLDNDGKIVHFGDSTNINEKLLWMVKLLELKKDINGEMFLQDVKKVYFRDKV